MNPVVSTYIVQGIYGITYGMILFLIASGLNIIFGMMGILNMAHTAFFMLAGYFCYQVVQMTGNFWMGLVFAPIFVAILGVLMEQLFLRRVLGSHVGELILTMGIASVIVAGIKKIWGTESLPLQMPDVLSGMVSIVGIGYPVYRLFVIGLALTVMLFMMLLLYRTRLGKVVRAAVSDREMVNALGININMVSMLVFGVGTWLAGLAGVVIAPILTVFPGLADQVGMDAFIVVVTGGFGSLQGAFIVSIIFGLLSSYGVQLVSQFAPVLMVVFMAIVLVFRPNGLFGAKAR